MTDSTLPTLEPSFLDSVFSRLATMEVELDEDPLQFGPKRLNGKIATARGMLTECERIYLHVSQLLQNFKTSHRTLELEFDIDKKHLYANDPEVMSHNFNVSSKPPEASVLPSGTIASDKRRFACPPSVDRALALATSHSVTT